MIPWLHKLFLLGFFFFSFSKTEALLPKAVLFKFWNNRNEHNRRAGTLADSMLGDVGVFPDHVHAKGAKKYPHVCLF